MTNHTPERRKPAEQVEIVSTGRIVRARFNTASIGTNEAQEIVEILVPAVIAAGRSLRVLVLDLNAVTYMNSMGLGMLIDLRNRASNENARTALLGVTDEVREILRVVNVEKMFDITPTERDLDELVRSV